MFDIPGRREWEDPTFPIKYIPLAFGLIVSWKRFWFTEINRDKKYHWPKLKQVSGTELGSIRIVILYFAIGMIIYTPEKIKIKMRKRKYPIKLVD